MEIKNIFQIKDLRLIVICLGLLLCFNFSRVVGDFMLSSGMPFLLTYHVVILLSNVLPLFLIFLGFRKISPLAGFCIVFLIACPGTIFADIVVFRAPPELLAIPAYLPNLIIVSVLLAVFAAGIAFLDRKRNAGLVLISVSTTLYLINLGIAIFPMIFGNLGGG